jgi:hypothetical protein
MTEVFPLERAAEACEHMMSGKARFEPFSQPGGRQAQERGVVVGQQH